MSQASLFQRPAVEQVVGEGASMVRCFRRLLPAPLLDEALAYFLASPEPAPERYRGVATHRRSAAYGPPGLRYRYAGQVLARLGSTARLALDASLEPFSFALVNVYPDGRAQLGWHSDQEPDLVPGAPILSLSLGGPRPFWLRRQDDPNRTASVELEHGDLLLMEGECQVEWEHCLPTCFPSSPRVNVTFRHVRTK